MIANDAHLQPRVVCQFSCGAASAVATKLALAKYGSTRDVQIINAFVVQEHEDNRRFLADCEGWFARPIVQLRDQKYGADIIRVFLRKQYISGRHGAPCTVELKRRLLDKWRNPDDVIVFGFTAEEEDRWQDWQERNPGLTALAPLVDARLSKEDCKAMVLRAGIRLPRMYEMGYENANCKGCVKGGEHYWRAVREDFPEEFEAMCLVQDVIGPGSWFLRYRSGPLKDQRFPLRDLPIGKAMRNEKLPDCSFFCLISEQEYTA